MTATNPLFTPEKQKGAALLLLLLLLIFVASSILVSSFSSARLASQRQAQTFSTLTDARDALIGAAVTNVTTPGQLPCPEDLTLIGTPNEGNAQSSCTLPAVGRLPWRTLKIDRLLDANGEQLWYVLSPGFRSAPINSNSLGALTVDSVANAAVALIIAPSAPLSGQTRNNAAPQRADYLDLGNASGNLFQTTGPSDTFNDLVVMLTTEQLMNPLEKKIIADVSNCLTNYSLDPANLGRFPWASPDVTYVETSNTLFGRLPDTPFAATCVSSGGTWNNTTSTCTGTNVMTWVWPGNCPITSNLGWWLSWKELVFYALAPRHVPFPSAPTQSCGTVADTQCVSVNAQSNKQFIVIVGGKALAAQVRGSTAEKNNAANYLEGGNQAGSDFLSGPKTTTFNDVSKFNP